MHTDSGFDLTTLDSLRAAFLNISDEDQERQLQAGHTNVDDVKSAMKDLEEILAKSRGVTKLEGVLSDISQVFDQLSLLVDPLAQLHAPVAPIVWGSVKIILQLAKGRKDVIEAIIDAFISMANNIPRICSYAGHRPTDLATTALSAAFREIVAFLIDVAKYLQQSKLKQFLPNSSLSSGIKKAKEILVERFRDAFYENCAIQFKETQQYHQDNQYQKLLVRLDSVNFSEDLLSRLERRLEGTCKWSNSHPVIRRWLDDTWEEDDLRLWLHGNPGTGKSILAAHVTDEATKNASPDEIVIYFFCDNKDASRKTSESMLRAFITQLVETKATYREEFEKLAQVVLKRGRSYRFSVRELQSHLVSLLASFSKSRFIIDGLDECDKEVFAVGGLVDTLDKLSRVSQSRVKLLFIGRREPFVHDCLRLWPQMEIGEKDTTQKDMQIFVIEQVAELVREVPQLRGREKDLKTGLLQAAGDMFLFVRLMVQDVIENKDLSLYEIERILERPPKDLNRMYEQYLVTLTKRNNQHAKAIAIRVLQWLTYAERPLTLTFLDVALALDVDDDGLDDAKRQSDILALLRRILGILVDCRRSDGNIIRAGLVHQSFKDFLRQTASDEEDLSVDLHALQHAIRPQRSHLSLLASCSSVLRASTIANPLMQYYDAVDQRRAERPRSKRLKPPEEIDHPQMGLLEIRLGEHGHRKHWKMWEYQWEIVQLEDLERTWMKREERENRARDGLQGLRGLAQVLLEVQVRWEQELVEIERLKVQQPLELEELQMLLQRPERELMVYSLRRFSAHLAGCIISHSSGHANVCLKKVLYQSLEQIVQSASAIAPSVDTQDIRWPSDVATIVNLVFALSGLESAVAQLMSSHLHLSSVAFDHSTASGQFAPQTKTIPVYCQALVSRILQTCRYFADVHIKSVYQVEVIDALREVPPRHQRPIQALLLATTRAISAFRDLEFALYRYDEQMPVAIGTSRLIYSIQCATNTLGRLGVSNLCTVLPEGHSLRRSLEDDDFLTSPALVPLQIADPRRQQPWNFDSGGNRLSAHLQVAMLCSLTVGMVNRVPLWGGVTCVALALAFFETFHPATHHPNHHLPCIVRLGARYFVLGNLVSHFGMATIVLALIFGAASVFHPTVPVNLRSLSTKRDPHPHADLIADPVAHIPGPSRHYSRWLLSKCLYIRASFCQPTTYAVMFVVLTAAACSSLARHLVSVLGITLLACDELFALLDSDGLHRASAALPQFPQRLLVFAPILRAKVHGCNVELKQCLKLMEGI